MDFKLSLAPIQGITDYNFRNLFHKHFSGVDTFYIPYLRIDKKLEVKPNKLKDVLPEFNENIPVVPQIMVNTTEAFLFATQLLTDYGYTEVNWNLGCPYPMVTNRKLGAGLLPHHETICSILDEVIEKSGISISIKMRSGLTDNSELEKIIPKLNTYPLSEIIIHPRYAKELYKKNADSELYSKCLNLSTHKLAYNGDISSIETFKRITQYTGNTTHYMLGRGLISNPFLAAQIKEDNTDNIANNLNAFWNFESELFDAVSEKLSGNTQIVMRMATYWEYFSQSFTNSHKVYKRFKKAKNIDSYHAAIEFAKESEEWNIFQ